ncbi:MAG: DNA polymerase III subunit gamma/tau [Rickettsiaceae bacterium]|nr:DNA polymerase III subunit gamma/tau [Rickettsiaceae bacterium]
MLLQKIYINLSRKYRPKNLSELHGQDVLVHVLTNAFLQGKLSQSYLLCGIRGVGKTTTARIIAKTVNCTNKSQDLIPCETCPNCVSFNQNSHPDIIEMDAASRTGVDDVRAIIENAEYKPMIGKFKVFIIDEVHMLSKNAFNALLKILEEPPEACIFIFATTEMHKIPLTIISRCQRFELKRINLQTLVDLLSKICAQEGVQIEQGALEIIARKGEGSARDSLSLLDQAILIANNQKITESTVEQMTGSNDYKICLDLITAILNQDADLGLKIISDYYATHTDFYVFMHNLLSATAYIAKKIACKNYNSPEFFAIEKEAQEISQKTDPIFLQILWKISYSSLQDLKQAENGLLNMEMLILKLIYVISTNSSSQKSNIINTNSQSEINNPTPLKENIALSTNIEDVKIHKTIIQEKTIPDASKHNNIIDFDLFLKYLSENKEMDIFYELFNKAEIIELNLDSIKIARAKKDIEFEKSVEKFVEKWAKRKISVQFIYKDNISSYKATIFADLEKNNIIARISKNFEELKMIDIITTNE